ncbi:MAG TPA: SDR family oxidoreductase [Noviherbaspirillum sp.]|nr:SDR family oxidoreductase [Noviherbaspirillum sp.]
MKKTVLITGCSSGIGRALAEQFHRSGYLVYATARRIDTLADLADAGMRVAALDVTDADSVSALRQLLGREQVKLDVLVNNAGYGAIGPLVEMPLPELRRQFETNVFSTIALVQAVLPNLLAAGSAKVVNISSVSGVMATPFAGAYCSSKAAVNILSDTLRLELAPLGIHIITVQPGGIASQFGQAARQSAEQLAPDSLYKPLQAQIHSRATASQDNAMPAEEFARKLFARLQAANPPAVIRLGPKSRLLPFLKRWLPARTLDGILSRKFGLDSFKGNGAH